MDINTAFPSKYLRSDDLQGRSVRVTIDHVVIEPMNDGTSKPIIYFRGKEKGMVLNRTNATAISEDFGSNTDMWPGQILELFSMKVSFQGQMKDGLRCRAVFPPRSQQATAPARPIGPPQPHASAPIAQHQPPRQEFAPVDSFPNENSNDFNDDIPFN